MTIQPNSREARDIAYHLHSSTNARTHETRGPTIIEKGEGVFVFDSDGRRYIEAMSGLWSVGVGFGEKRLIDAAAKQLALLPYYHTFQHRSNGPVIDLAEKLISIAPAPMSKVYFTNSGSEANDSIIKFVRYRSNALGLPSKKKIIARERGFHGVTVGAASLTGLSVNHRGFDLPIGGILHTTCPDYLNLHHEGETPKQFATRCADELETLIIREGPETIAAFIGEPLMGAGGLILPPPTYWEKVQKVLRKYDVLLAVDEVICGFGRTGKMFACETYDITPDIITVSKQLSSSYYPIGALLLNEKVYAPIADQASEIGVLGHGYTTSGHPVACAVALENLRIIEGDGLIMNARLMGDLLLEGLSKLVDFDFVADVRGVGLLAGVEFRPSRGRNAQEIAVMTFETMLANGVISRAVGSTIAFCPPLIVNPSEIAMIIKGAADAVSDVGRILAA
ncbi:aminotransferase [Agrobacterium arsenijevicii]|uniref:Aminotransferase n=1 Tax=Agrobacterium arsenijevicii TaxID=1585697 RepID=A0ABR5D0N3_9HYPH|nr:aminotransferase [Agrobacterium arsenijevicii]